MPDTASAPMTQFSPRGRRYASAVAKLPRIAPAMKRTIANTLADSYLTEVTVPILIGADAPGVERQSKIGSAEDVLTWSRLSKLGWSYMNSRPSPPVPDRSTLSATPSCSPGKQALGRRNEAQVGGDLLVLAARPVGQATREPGEVRYLGVDERGVDQLSLAVQAADEEEDADRAGMNGLVDRARPERERRLAVEQQLAAVGDRR